MPAPKQWQVWNKPREQPWRSNVPRVHAGSSLLSMGKESNCYTPPAARFNCSPCSAVSNSCVHLANDKSGTLFLVSMEEQITPDSHPDFPPIWPKYQRYTILGSSKYLFFLTVTNRGHVIEPKKVLKMIKAKCLQLIFFESSGKHLSQAPLKPGRNICLVRQHPPSMETGNRISKAVSANGSFWYIWKQTDTVNVL